MGPLLTLEPTCSEKFGRDRREAPVTNQFVVLEQSGAVKHSARCWTSDVFGALEPCAVQASFSTFLQLLSVAIKLAGNVMQATICQTPFAIAEPSQGELGRKGW